MTVVPDWFEHNFVNMEDMLIALFTVVFPGVACGVWTPDQWLDQEMPGPMLSFVRLPGGTVDYDKQSDDALIQIVAATNDRDESTEIISAVRSILLPMQSFKVPMPDGYTATIKGVTETGGPQMLIPAQQIDTRLVPATFKVCVGLRSRERYDAIIRALFGA